MDLSLHLHEKQTARDFLLSGNDFWVVACTEVDPANPTIQADAVGVGSIGRLSPNEMYVEDYYVGQYKAKPSPGGFYLDF
jgi:hypothetical protein